MSLISSSKASYLNRKIHMKRKWEICANINILEYNYISEAWWHVYSKISMHFNTILCIHILAFPHYTFTFNIIHFNTTLCIYILAFQHYTMHLLSYITHLKMYHTLGLKLVLPLREKELSNPS